MASRLTTFIVVLIVAGTLIAGLIVGAQRDDMDGPVDLIITNGRIYTGSSTTFAEALAVRGNKILRVGTNREIKRLRRRQTVALDAHGATVLPGFNDAHVQLVEGGLALAGVDLTGVAPDEVGARLREYIERHPDREWVVGRNWAPADSIVPPRQQLDALLPDRPVYLVEPDAAAGWANTPALRLAGITRRTASLVPQDVEREPRTGEPTGRLEGAAHAIVLGAASSAAHADHEAAVRAAIAEAHRLGITSVQEFGRAPDRLSILDTLRSSGDLPLRVYAALPLLPGAVAADVAGLDAVGRQYPDDPVLKAGPASIQVDDAMPPATDESMVSGSSASIAAADLERLVSALDRRGWQIELHAGGEGAVQASLDVLERAAGGNRSRDAERRHRIEGIEELDPGDAARFAAAHVVASLQPAGDRAIPARMMLFESRGPGRASAEWPLHALQAAHARIVLGSQWPSRSLDPRFGLGAVLGRMELPDEAEPAAERQAAALAAAIDAYTTTAAWASFDEQRKGVLASDMLADIVILSSDIFAPGARVLDAVVDTTIFDGQIVYSRSGPEHTD